ncbi:hypothetical protein [Plantactinospora sp. GCM10030261]|uniref:hypothetical protein n=1 Tax=Plantactinospora sp. GCM10030261 TaxID=3273420 RepID=UPI0036069EC6
MRPQGTSALDTPLRDVVRTPTRRWPALPAGWWTVVRRPGGRTATVGWLVVALILDAPVTPAVPRTGLDPGWVTGINVASTEGLRFGRELIFTYGPWGFLDRPLLVSGTQFAQGVLFAALVTTAVFVAAYLCLRRLCRPTIVGPAALLVVLLVPNSEPGLALVAATVAVTLLDLRWGEGRAQRWQDSWPVAALGALAALLCQVKFSEGLIMLALAGAVALRATTRRGVARGLAVAATVFAFATLLFWIIAGQRPGDLAGWFTGSWDLASGYAAGMAKEEYHRVGGYLAAAGLALVAAVSVTGLVRAGGRRTALHLVPPLAIAVAFGLKAGFVRHDSYHEWTFFLLLAFALLALAGHARRAGAPLIAALLAVGLLPHAQAFDAIAAMDRWRETGRVVFDQNQRAAALAGAANQARQAYRLPPDLVAATRGHPVSVDPWEATLPWAYGLDWRPVPVFQTYAAYTVGLDERNARAIASAAADHRVLRRPGLAIDGRNHRWETPRYLLELTCGYRVETESGGWLLLRHVGDRCGPARSLATRSVRAGERVDTPVAAPGEIVVARYVPDAPSPIAALTRTLFKEPGPTTATVDGTRHPVPAAVRDAPLLVSVPARSAVGAPFGYRTLSFDRSGTVRFEAITLR